MNPDEDETEELDIWDDYLDTYDEELDRYLDQLPDKWDGEPLPNNQPPKKER